MVNFSRRTKQKVKVQRIKGLRIQVNLLDLNPVAPALPFGSDGQQIAPVAMKVKHIIKKPTDFYGLFH
jgi:hypothetical protein